uniref:Uncharacterized protein n=1 Tax=Chromera velia CCMP2878 TaxID=1169474 RepID=A0A0G4HIK1_9ALVE|eukprot:Cvel_27989.t1-p1 / transcript=Cvel_27989.t1 / gene=Cvel_27989 / organism=Chromera_velia_CCMP2878 / gene_product=hypothetical protein / transcript_product=hypothetical protein / location=Cvel_scaffold3583:11834-15522(-) / protein_length=967 / sequence_SO=supercontig / SO=protein_coding / is_pseudo=false
MSGGSRDCKEEGESQSIQHGLCVLEAVVSLLLGRARLSALLAARQGEPTETAASAVARRHLSRLAALRENEKETESGGKGGSPSSSVLLQGLVSSEAQLWRAVCDRVNETASRREQKSKRKAESVAGALLLGSSTKRATVRHLSWAMGRLHALCVAAAASEKAFKTVSSVPCSKSLPPADSGTSKKIPPTAPGDGHSRGRGGMMGGTSLSASAIPSTSASSASTAVAPAGVGRSGAVEVFGSGGLNVSRERERGHGGVPRPRPPPRRESEKDANDLLTATAAAVGGGAEQREPSDASREGRSAYRGRELGVPKGGVSVRRTRSRSFVRSRVDGVTGDEVIRSVCYACDDDDSPRGEKLGLNENEGEGGKEKRHESTQLDPDCEGKEKQAESGKKEEGGNKKEKEEKKTPPEASKAFPHSPPNWPSESEMGGGTQTHPNEAIDTVSSAAPPLGPGGPTQMGGVSGGPLDSHLEAEKDRPRVAWPPEDAGEGDDEGQQQQQQQQQQGGRDREVPVTIVVSPSAHLSGVEAGLVEEGKEGDGFPWGGEAESATEELLVSSVKKEKRRRAPESTQQENGLAVQVQESQQEEFEKGGAGGRGSGEGEEREFEVPWGGEAEAGREEILGGEEAGLFESPRRRLPEAGRTLTPPRECPFSPVAPGCAPKGSPDRFSASQSQGERAQPQGGVAHEGASAMTDTLGRSEGRLEREEEGGDREGSPLLPMVRIGDWSDAVLVEIWGRTGSDGMPRDFCGEVWVHGPILSQMPFRNDSLCRIFLKLGQPSAASLTGKGRTRGAFRKEPNPNLEEEREPEGEGDTLATQSHHHLRLGPFLDVQLDWIRAGRDAVLRLSVIEAQGLRPPPSFLEPLEDLSGGNRGAPHLGVPSDAGSRGGLQTFRPVAAVWVRDGVTGVFNCLHITAPAQVSYTQGSPQSTHAGGSSSASGQRKRFVWNETFDLRLNLQIMHKQQQQQPH